MKFWQILTFAFAVNMISAAGRSLSDGGKRELLATCSMPSTSVIRVVGGYPILTLLATGHIRYYCNDDILAIEHGEAFANFTSDDGIWVGTHTYPVSGPTIGQPTWWLHNTVTGDKRTIFGENKPSVREDDPNGSDIDWWRREIYGDITDGSPTASPQAWWVIRNETTSAGKPESTKCNGDIDVLSDFTAKYTFISCDYYRGSPPPPALPPTEEIPLLAAVAAVESALVTIPTPAPAPAPAPAPEPEVDVILGVIDPQVRMMGTMGPMSAPVPEASPPLPSPVPVAEPVVIQPINYDLVNSKSATNSAIVHYPHAASLVLTCAMVAAALL